MLWRCRYASIDLVCDRLKRKLRKVWQCLQHAGALSPLRKQIGWQPCLGQVSHTWLLPSSTMYQLGNSKIASLASVPALRAGKMRQPTLDLQHNDASLA